MGKICISTEIGNICIVEIDGYITEVYFSNKKGNNTEENCSLILEEAKNEIMEYLAGNLKEFTIPVKFIGTEFQNMVWNALLEISYGETKTYKEIAEKIGIPKAYRAVGMACNRNPLPIILPCHRVVGQNRSITGYAGGIELKEKLLNMEKNTVLSLR